MNFFIQEEQHTIPVRVQVICISILINNPVDNETTTEAGTIFSTLIHRQRLTNQSTQLFGWSI